jgi:AhpD family alkylhydroperoxidase
VHEAFENFSHAVLADGALPERTKELSAVAVAHVTQCPYCSNGHPRRARRKGASPEEIMGGDLGNGGDARRRRRRARHPCPAGDERGIVGRDDALSEASTSHLPATWRRP